MEIIKDGILLNLSEFSLLFSPAKGKPSKDQSLSRALIRATFAAMQRCNADDGGTCNFDAPALDYKRLGLSKAHAAEIICSVGLRCFEWKPFRYSYLVVTGFQRGQANRRSEMSEAFSESLHADLIPVTMYYQMD